MIIPLISIVNDCTILIFTESKPIQPQHSQTMLKKLRIKRQGSVSKDTVSKDGSSRSRYQSRKVTSNKEGTKTSSSIRDTKNPNPSPSRRSKQKHRSKSPWKYANKSSSSASRRTSSTASTAASTAASSHASTAPRNPDEYGQLLATQIVDTTEPAEKEVIDVVLSTSGSDITTGPVDDLLFALGDAINKGANEVEDFVEVTIADGFESILNSWDRFTVGLTLKYGDNSTIGTDFSDEREVKLVKEKGLGGLEIIEEDSQGTAKSSITGNIKSQVQGLIDNFFLVEM